MSVETDLAALTVAAQNLKTQTEQNIGSLESISICGDEPDDPDGLDASLCNCIKENMTLVIPTDYPDLETCLNTFKLKRCACGVIITIQLPPGEVVFDHPIEINQNCTFKIVGIPPLANTITGIANVIVTYSGEGEPLQQLVSYTLSSYNNIENNNYVMIVDADDTTMSGTGPNSGDFYTCVHEGVWEVIDAESGTHVTVMNTCDNNSIVEHPINAGNVVIYQTVIKFTNSDGFINNGVLILDDLVIVGVGDNINHQTGVTNLNILEMGENVGISNFGSGLISLQGSILNAKRLAVSSCLSRNAVFLKGCNASFNYLIANGNYGIGLTVYIEASVLIDDSVNILENLTPIAKGGSLSGNQCGFIIESQAVMQLTGNFRVLSNTGRDGFAAHGSTVGFSDSVTFDYSTISTETGAGINSRAFYDCPTP